MQALMGYDYFLGMKMEKEERIFFRPLSIIHKIHYTPVPYLNC